MGSNGSFELPPELADLCRLSSITGGGGGGAEILADTGRRLFRDIIKGLKKFKKRVKFLQFFICFRIARVWNSNQFLDFFLIFLVMPFLSCFFRFLLNKKSKPSVGCCGIPVLRTGVEMLLFPRTLFPLKLWLELLWLLLSGV